MAGPSPLWSGDGRHGDRRPRRAGAGRLVSAAAGPVGTDRLIALIAVATLSTAPAWPIFCRVLSHTTPTVASTVTFIVPAFGITWGAIVLSGSVGPRLLAGLGSCSRA